ncbi:hypothetical protein BDZ94DRAFT_1326212 [Collybia nuda]|uniref:Transmembrane protein n=1 Tax=Collybia nuda TaxID=64659 RepID=A0A9P5XXP3_9AGAR|nr:hypothetical protein BDZ94DRAFT_1326212 [Collybia nuda]
MADSSEFDPSQLPNPFTPMAFLPPELAYQKAVTTYVYVGMLGILVWDILIHLGADYKLLTRYRPNIPTLIYFISRWSSLLYSVSSVIFETAPVEDCRVFSKVTCAVYHPAVSATALLFFFRVRALYDGNKYITAVFLFMWLAVLGTSLTVVASLTGVHIGNTKYCTFAGFRPYGSSSNIVIAVFDTCVFVAISWRIMTSDSPTDGGGGFRLSGKHLSQFSKALLQDGQNYYLVAMVCNLLVLIMTYIHGVPTVYRTIFLVPAVGLTNIMACRVFRNTKLRHPDEADTSILSTMFRHSGQTTSVFIHTERTGSTVLSIDREGLHTTSISNTDITSSGSSDEKLPHLSRTMSAV